MKEMGEAAIRGDFRDAAVNPGEMFARCIRAGEIVPGGPIWDVKVEKLPYK
jgi:hypothetical protein